MWRQTVSECEDATHDKSYRYFIFHILNHERSLNRYQLSFGTKVSSFHQLSAGIEFFDANYKTFK